jgi:hypothetical protein
MMMDVAAAAAGERHDLRGHRQGAASKDSVNLTRTALTSLAPNLRACARAKLFLGRDVADPTQSDPLAPRPARTGWAALRQFRFRDIPLWGERR